MIVDGSQSQVRDLLKPVDLYGRIQSVMLSISRRKDGKVRQQMFVSALKEHHCLHQNYQMERRGECRCGTCRTSVSTICLFLSCWSVEPMPKTGTLLLSASLM